MVKRTYRVDLTTEAYTILEAGAFLTGESLKNLASNIIIHGSTQESKDVAAKKLKSEITYSRTTTVRRDVTRVRRESQLTPELEARIIELWGQTHNRAEIARTIDKPGSSTKLWIRKLLKRGIIQE
jgi:hypothetical protein